MPQLFDHSPGVEVMHLGVMLRCHARHAYLPDIFAMVRRLVPKAAKKSFHITFSIGVDRPTADVVCEINREMRRPWRRGKYYYHPSFPIVSTAGFEWMQQLRALHEAHLADCLDNVGSPPDAILLLEDDRLLTPAGERELRGHLTFLEHDRLDVEAKFCWDDPAQINTDVLEHWCALLWRHYRGDEFPLNRVVNAPNAATNSPRSLRLTHPMKDFGWLTSEERERSWLANKEAGRIDHFTLALQRKPVLKPWPSPDQIPSA